MLELVSVSGYSKRDVKGPQAFAGKAASARRGGLLHGTKVSTTGGWKRVERLVAGDLVRTLDHGFQELRRVSVDRIVVPGDERRSEHLPVLVPSRAAYNGRPVWLMPEQGVALDQGKLAVGIEGISVIPARLLSGVGRLKSDTPAQSFDVTSLFFDQDELVFIEGGFQAYCASGRMSAAPVRNRVRYEVADDEHADLLIEAVENRGDISALANPLAALPAPMSQEPIFPIRPSMGIRRPGRPGRPDVPALFLRPEWKSQ
ncbi:Hint domain-containing protein [Ruegeria halocynthiae]|uniref:Hint domain-containing protein n=1 Tax=Ruegeria halocynthiae TaxID=985054 RepID=A0A1H2V050_9RHOB|nr:Hint domain-containing protein [Ruegeria halocynthiae]SDW61299.1 Hint domain-containing protein [Ruegeria halocynthiae]